MRPTEHSPIIDAILDYYADKHSIKETAEKFGVSIERVKYLAKREGVHNNRTAKEVCTINGAKGAKYLREQNRIQKQEAETKLAIRCLEHGFGYIGGYDGKGSQVAFTHLACGSTFNRRSEHFDRYGWKCPVCEENKRKAEQEEAKRLKEAEWKATQEEWKRKKEEKQKAEETILDAIHSCSVCGKSYTIRDYMQSTGMSYRRDSGFCSAECRDIQKKIIKKKYKTNGSHTHRARKYGVEWERGITLRSAVNRFGLICALCGEPCDWNDRSWTKYFGPKYPSIDHIIPLSKGGTHTWNNVQVAHIICNDLKETSILA